MQTVLLATLGSPGDIRPFIALGVALKAHDFRPIFLANPYDAPAIGAHGLETIFAGESWDLMTLVASDPKYLLSPQAGLHTTRDIFIPFSERLYPVTLEAINQHHPTAVISHPFCFGSTWAAEIRGVPRAVVHLAPISLMTKEVFQHYAFPYRALMSLLVPLGKKQFNALIRPLCTALGLPWRRDMLQHAMVEPDLLLGMWSPQFACFTPSAERAELTLCGFPSLEEEENPLSPELICFLEEGPPPVALTLGTNAYSFAGSFFDDAVAVLTRAGHRVIVITKKRLPNMPPQVHVTPYAAYAALFPQCAAVIHHGGAGVTGAALVAGKPAVVIPFGHDQHDNGLRVQQLGAGRLVDRRRVRRKLAGALGAILSEEVRAKASALGAQIRTEEEGASAAAHKIKEWLAP